MIKRRLAALFALIATVAAQAAPLGAPTAVHTKPDANAPVISVLAPGTEPMPAADALATTPAGWMAVKLTGPFEGFVFNGDVDKALNIKPGAAIRLQPAKDAGVLAVMSKGDKTTITGLHGKWSRIKLEKAVTGFIHVAGPATAVTQPVLHDSAPMAPLPAQSGAAAPATAPAPAYLPPPAPASTNVSDAGSGVLPRLFQGKFVSTRRPFMPRRPYDWQLNDDAGVRYAYLDISKLLLTEQIEKFVDHDVVVYGTPKAAGDGKNIVIAVESLRLK